MYMLCISINATFVLINDECHLTMHSFPLMIYSNDCVMFFFCVVNWCPWMSFLRIHRPLHTADIVRFASSTRKLRQCPQTDGEAQSLFRMLTVEIDIYIYKCMVMYVIEVDIFLYIRAIKFSATRNIVVV